MDTFEVNTNNEHGSSLRVVLCVTGCIAAYKACEVLRALEKASCDVRVVMSEDACRFVGSATFEALSKHPVLLDLFDYPETPIPHVELSGWADLVLVCPATGNILAKVAAGIADDAVSTTLLAGWEKLLIAPAMNVHMWENPATQANVETLTRRGARFVLPDEGRLACGEVGMGKLAEVHVIVNHALEMLGANAHGPRSDARLASKRLVITAGPTHEAIDPVRYIANRSTGKMGYAIAQAALDAGAHVTLVSGPTSLVAPEGCDVVSVISAHEMYNAALTAFEHADAAVCAAAVADYTPAFPADHKLKKEYERLDTLTLIETKDILAELSRRKDNRVVVGFAAETNDVVAHARAKLARKGCDLIVANDVSRSDSGFGSDTNAVWIVSPAGVEEFSCMPKREVARLLVDRVADALEARKETHEALM